MDYKWRIECEYLFELKMFEFFRSFLPNAFLSAGLEKCWECETAIVSIQTLHYNCLPLPRSSKTPRSILCSSSQEYPLFLHHQPLLTEYPIKSRPPLKKALLLSQTEKWQERRTMMMKQFHYFLRSFSAAQQTTFCLPASDRCLLNVWNEGKKNDFI